MKKKCLMFATVLLLLSISTYARSEGDVDILFHASTIDALLEGLYDGTITFSELREHGNIGLGTFNELDGEMVLMDGVFYKIRTDGKVYPVNSSEKTPFAAVTYFESDKRISCKKDYSYKELEEYIDTQLPTENIFYTFKIKGTFSYIKTRSVPKQEKPYKDLVDIVKTESAFFEYKDITGTLVGFKCPAFVKGINVPNYHLHFISEDKKSGGHLLECTTKDVSIEIDYTGAFFMVLPDSKEYYDMQLDKDNTANLNAVEKDKKE